MVLPATLSASLMLAPTPVLSAPNDTAAKTSQTDARKSNGPAQQAEQFIKSARAELKKEQFAASREFLEKARAADPKASGLDQLAKDIAAAEQAAATRARNERVAALVRAADDRRKAGRFDEATVEVTKALELDPASSRAKSLRDRIESERTKAMQDQVRAAVNDRIKAADRAISAKRFDEARRNEAAAREAAKGPFKPELDRLAAKIAKEESAAIAAKNRTEISGLLKTANTELKANQFDKARQTVGRVFAIDKANKDANSLLAKIGAEEKKFVAASQERKLREDLAAADRLLKAKNYDGASKAYTAILASAPGNSAAKRGLDASNKGLAASATDAQRKAAEEKKAADAAAAKKAAEEKKAADAAAAKKAAEDKAAAAAAAKKAAEDKAAADAAAKKAADEQKAAAAAAAKKAAEDKAAAEAAAKASAATVAAAAPVAAAEQPFSAPPAAVPDSPFAAAPTPAPAPAVPDSPFAAPPAVAEAPAPAVVAAPTPAATPRPTPTPNAAAARAEAQRIENERKAAEAAEKAAEAARQAETDRLRRERSRQAELAYDEGVALYKKGELARARQRWLDAKDLDPTFLKADAYLANTEAEYNALQANEAAKRDLERREAEALEKMNTPIPLRTIGAMGLADFLQNLRVLSGIDFVIAGEVNAKIEGAWEDVELHEVLNSSLLPIGLRWRREPGKSIVIVEPDLRTEVFRLAPDQVATVDALIDSGTLPRLLYGDKGVPALVGQEIVLDPARNMLIITDSEMNIGKIRKIQESLRGQQRAALVFDSYEIDESKAPEIKALLSALLVADDLQPFNPERKLIIEGSTLIIKDTAENVQKVRNILQDKRFLDKFYGNELTIATFNLTPITQFADNPDLARSFADQVRSVVETLLYSQEGYSKAESEGRRLWFDPASLQLTITDTGDRIATVQNFIENLPQIDSRRRSKIIFLDHANASDLAGQIESFLGISASAASTASSGNEVRKTLGVQDSFDFQGANFRVTRVNENDATNKNDDSVELVVRTGTTSQDVTIEEFRSQFVEDFEIIADDIKPSNTPGEGRARLTIRYVPGTTGGTAGDAEQQQAEATAEEQRAQVREQTGLTIVEIENLNAIFVEYDSVEELRRVEFWVRTLDIPTLQVDIEIKFVEVATNKAKEIKPEFSIGNLTDGFDLSDSVLGSRFAQDRDEFRSPFEPPLEGNEAANLLKGATVFNYLVSNGSSPISLTLRVLEAQGIINVVNGPRVTVLNTETADFIVERSFGSPRPLDGATGGGGTAGGTQRISLVPSITPVDLSITPNVTRAGNITLDIDVNMEDIDQNIGQLVTLDPTAASALAPATTLPQASRFADVGRIRKELTTKARIKDGGTVVLGGWRSERTQDLESGVPILRDIPFIGKYLFNRSQNTEDKITLLIFLTGNVVKD